MTIHASFYVALCRLSNITDSAKYFIAFSFMVRQLNLLLLDLCKKIQILHSKFLYFFTRIKCSYVGNPKMLWCEYWFILTDNVVIRW